MHDEDKEYVESIRKHSDKTREFQEYSLKRIDTLLIVISGAGIYIILEVLKFIHEKDLKVSEQSIKIGGVFFALSIGLNFISQWYSYRANSLEEKWAKLEIERICDKDSSTPDPGFYKIELKKLTDKVDTSNLIIGIINIASTIVMMLGIVITGYFCYVTF